MTRRERWELLAWGVMLGIVATALTGAYLWNGTH